MLRMYGTFFIDKKRRRASQNYVTKSYLPNQCVLQNLKQNHRTCFFGKYLSLHFLRFHRSKQLAQGLYLLNGLNIAPWWIHLFYYIHEER